MSIDELADVYQQVPVKLQCADARQVAAQI